MQKKEGVTEGGRSERGRKGEVGGMKERQTDEGRGRNRET